MVSAGWGLARRRRSLRSCDAACRRRRRRVDSRAAAAPPLRSRHRAGGGRSRQRCGLPRGAAGSSSGEQGASTGAPHGAAGPPMRDLSVVDRRRWRSADRRRRWRAHGGRSRARRRRCRSRPRAMARSSGWPVSAARTTRSSAERVPTPARPDRAIPPDAGSPSPGRARRAWPSLSGSGSLRQRLQRRHPHAGPALVGRAGAAAAPRAWRPRSARRSRSAPVPRSGLASARSAAAIARAFRWRSSAWSTGPRARDRRAGCVGERGHGGASPVRDSAWRRRSGIGRRAPRSADSSAPRASGEPVRRAGRRSPGRPAIGRWRAHHRGAG